MRKVREGNEPKTVSGGKHLNASVYKFLLSLKLGDKVTLVKEEWEGITPFTHAIHSSASLKGKFSCKTLADRTGWLVIRIKN